jgi:hypothetical protein
VTAPVMTPAPADEPEAATIEWLLDATRNGYEHDYRAWGRAAAALATEFPDLLEQLAVESLTARARGRVTREAKRTADGVARVIADAETGQVTAWPDWTDSIKVRTTGDRIEREGRQKVVLGRRMKAVADAMDMVGGGVSGRDAWAAIGGDASLLDEAEDLPTGTDG